MRPITSTDILDFYNSRSDLLALTATGEFDTIDHNDLAADQDTPTTYSYATLDTGEQVQILLERSTITDGDWFPDALTDDGDLDPEVAAEMADLINQDGIQPGVVTAAVQAEEDRKKAQTAADQAAMTRAEKVTELVAYCGGNQSHAARLLGVDQSAVNRLVRKARTADAVEGGS